MSQSADVAGSHGNRPAQSLAASQALRSAIPFKIEQGFGQGHQPLQRQAANQAFLLRAQGPTAAAQQAQVTLASPGLLVN